MHKLKFTEKGILAAAKLEEESADFTVMNPNSPCYKKPKDDETDEIDYSWDLNEEDKK